MRVKLNRRFLFGEHVLEKGIEIAWNIHAKNPTLIKKACFLNYHRRVKAGT
jgi:hypothetical protein